MRSPRGYHVEDQGVRASVRCHIPRVQGRLFHRGQAAAAHAVQVKRHHLHQAERVGGRHGRRADVRGRGYEVVSAGKSKADGGWCFDGSNVPKAGASQRSSAQKKDKSRRKGKGGFAGEIAKSGFYLVVAAVLVLGYYAMRAYAGNRRGGSHSTARMAARMAAEARAQRANAYAKASHYL